MKRPSFLLFVAAFASLAAGGCKTKEKFPSLGTGMASPIDVAASEDGNYFYVLNADFDRTYDTGSLLVLDKEGNKIRAVEVPRMGRSLTVAGNDLIATIDFPNEKDDAHVMLFDISDASNPVLRRDFEIGCTPFNAVAAKDYEYFFVTCMSGALYAGRFGQPRENSTLEEVRYYGTTRRALYLDPKRNLLLGFTTDVSKQLTADKVLADGNSYDAKFDPIMNGDQGVPNEVPDSMESNKRVSGNKTQRQLFQFFVYDIAAEKENAPLCTVVPDEEDCAFPYRANSDPIVEQELRWIYFELTNFDGTPDPSDGYADPNMKYYRTNFYDAKADPSDPDVFYLSHRGNPSKSPFANQIVRVTITGDLRVPPPESLPEPTTPGRPGESTPTVEIPVPPQTGNVMTFDRVYGFKGAQATKYVFPGDFEVQEIAGQKTLIVNNFRDLINWVRDDTYFSLGAQVIDDPSWFAERSAEDGDLSAADVEGPLTSYYQVALTPEGKALSCSFYGNAVMLLDVKPGIGISEPKRIE